ncbi:endochitinase-like [Anthonomus grandis grandis]|uniref:endochitinase-like n=1 Tax=Anthonomus grandis grandis TaxID=2921223 RepID=UPI002165467C|nr:endochitinase-like [Anthonomus grandis grandis]
MKLLLSAAFLSLTILKVHSVAVVCYYGSWSAWDGITPENFDASLCTHINYAFISIWEDGNLRVEDDELDIDQGLYKRVTDLKNQNPNLKVLLSVGGDSAADLFRGMAGDASKRGPFVGSATYFLSAYNFDGLDIDWEYPEVADQDNYITLLKELKAAFQPKGWLLTAAVSSDTEHGYLISEMVQYFDFINVMTYDFYGPWSDYTGQNSALYSSNVESDWEKSHLNVAAAANNWVNAGVPKNKLTIGTGFYGRSFTLSDPNNHGLHAGIIGPGNDGGEATYAHICSTYDGWTRVWDDEQKNPYRYSGNQWIGYDDQDSIWAKAAWIKDNGFLGVMIWAIDQDDIAGVCGEKQILLKQINRAIA